MAMHLAAWYENVAPTGNFLAINGVVDEVLLVEGDDIRVPRDLPNIIGAAALTTAAAPLRAQIQSPSLRSLTNLDVEPIVNAATFGEPAEVLWHPASPIPVVGDEALNMYIQGAAGAAVPHYGAVMLSDGEQLPVTGRMFSVRATSVINQQPASWQSGNLAFSQTLPAGTYQIVGMRARSADGVLARLVFRGGTWRPGVPMVNGEAEEDVFMFRFGRSGVFGAFEHTTPPGIEVLGGVAASQVYILDMIKTA